MEKPSLRNAIRLYEQLREMARENRMAAKMHISELLQDEIDERGWDLDELAFRMVEHWDPHAWQVTRLALDFLFELRCANMVIGQKTANELSRAFDIDPQFFVNFHEDWRKDNLPCRESCCRHN